MSDKVTSIAKDSLFVKIAEDVLGFTSAKRFDIEIMVSTENEILCIGEPIYGIGEHLPLFVLTLQGCNDVIFKVSRKDLVKKFESIYEEVERIVKEKRPVVKTYDIYRPVFLFASGLPWLCHGYVKGSTVIPEQLGFLSSSLIVIVDLSAFWIPRIILLFLKSKAIYRELLSLSLRTLSSLEE